MHVLPPKIAYYLHNLLNFPSQTQFVQVATISNDGPIIRTMKLSKITDEGFIYLLSNTQTEKWKNLKSNNRIEVLLFDAANKLQIKASGSAELKSDPTDQELIDLWQKVRADVKKAIAQDLNNSTFPSSNFGIICVKPSYWEILKIDPTFYPDSQREAFVFNGSHWIENKLAVIS